MGWKSWPTWLKWGITFGALDIIAILFAVLTSHPYEAQLMALDIVQFPFMLLFPFQNMPSLIIGGLITWFLIGALIGLIINKLKK